MKRSEGLGCQNGAGCGCGWLSNGFHICLALFAATRVQDAQWALQRPEGTAQLWADLAYPWDGPVPCWPSRGQDVVGSSHSGIPCLPLPTPPPSPTPAPGSWAPAGLHRLFALLMRFPRDSIWLFNCSGMGLGCFDSELVSFLGYSFR